MIDANNVDKNISTNSIIKIVIIIHTNPRTIPAIAIPLPSCPDFLIWLSPTNPKIMARIGANGIKKTMPNTRDNIANILVPVSDVLLFTTLVAIRQENK